MSTQPQSSSPTKSRRPDLSTLRAPKSPIHRFFWRWKMWFAGTFVTSMLEPWETFVLLTFILIFILLLVGGIYRYLPSQASFLVKRAQYYLVGTDPSGVGDDPSFHTMEL